MQEVEDHHPGGSRRGDATNVGKLVILWLIVLGRKISDLQEEKKKGHTYYVEWDSDASSDSDDEKSTSKSLAGIAINKKLSIFNTPSSCFMAKSPKV